jgi:hypothetical protein
MGVAVLGFGHRVMDVASDQFCRLGESSIMKRSIHPSSVVRRPSSVVRRPHPGISFAITLRTLYADRGAESAARLDVRFCVGWRRLLSLLENLFDQALAKLEPADRLKLMESLAAKALTSLSADDRRVVLDHVVDRFMEGLSQEQQVALVREVLPHLLGRLLEAGNMSVDDFLWAAMGSLGALEGKARPAPAETPGGDVAPATPQPAEAG